MASKALGRRQLGVTSSHRRSLLRNMATSLFKHERIETTIAKAKELRPYAEKLITHAKKGEHFMVRRQIHDKMVYKKLFEVIAPRYAQRPGGYTRILRIAPRLGDNATTGLIMLVSSCRRCARAGLNTGASLSSFTVFILNRYSSVSSFILSIISMNMAYASCWYSTRGSRWP